MTTTTNGASHRSRGRGGRSRPRNDEHVIRTLERITPPSLIPHVRAGTRLVVAVPVLLVIGGLVVVALHSSVGIGVVGLGAVMLVVGVLWVLSGALVGLPGRIVASLPVAWVDPGAMERLMNLLEALCVQNGLNVPTVHMLNDDAQNAVVLGWSDRDAVLVLTTGILESCSRIELEGVIAHELAHIKSKDMRNAAFAYLACSPLALVSDVTGRLVDGLLSPRRQTDADVGGVSMTRYPPGLAQALSRISLAPGRPAGISNTAARLTASSWLVPFSEARPTRERPGHLEVEERIALLAEL